MVFRDRVEAGQRLAEQFRAASRENLVVLGIPRGGVVVAFELARALNVPLDVFLSAKLPVPRQEELAFGAMVEDGACFLNEEIICAAHVSPAQIESAKTAAAERLREKVRRYRADRPAIEIEGKAVILVDDGIATGASMLASVQALRARQVARLTIAVPVAPALTCARLRRLVDELVCLVEPEDFGAVSLFYFDFLQTGDDEVMELLRHATTLAP